jgi:hypothetical protein
MKDAAFFFPLYRKDEPRTLQLVVKGVLCSGQHDYSLCLNTTRHA